MERRRAARIAFGLLVLLAGDAVGADLSASGIVAPGIYDDADNDSTPPAPIDPGPTVTVAVLRPDLVPARLPRELPVRPPAPAGAVSSRAPRPPPSA